MTVQQQYQHEVKELSRNIIRSRMPEPKMMDASFCNDIPNSFYTWAWSDFKIASGSIVLNKWIVDNGFKICKKSEATCLLQFGEKTENQFWVKSKNIWLMPNN